MVLYSAPLQGFTDAVWRNAHYKLFGGVDAYFTPFIRVERGGFRARDIRDILPERNTANAVVPQLIASSAEEADMIVDKIMEYGYNRIDINFGCPFPLIARHGRGSGILPYVDKVESVLTVADNYPECQFSVKMRLGWDSEQECMPILDMINASKIVSVTMHPRLGVSQYKGDVDIDAFNAVYERCAKPLIYNGDICSVEDINNIVSKYPRLFGVMIGRGLLKNPALSAQYATDREVKLADYKMFHDEMFSQYSQYLQGDAHILNKMKSLWEYFMPDIDRKIHKAISKSNNMSRYHAAVEGAWH